MKLETARAGLGQATLLQGLAQQGLRRLSDRARRWRLDSRKLHDVERLLTAEDRLIRDAGLDRAELQAEAARLRAALRP